MHCMSICMYDAYSAAQNGIYQCSVRDAGQMTSDLPSSACCWERFSTTEMTIADKAWKLIQNGENRLTHVHTYNAYAQLWMLVFIRLRTYIPNNLKYLLPRPISSARMPLNPHLHQERFINRMYVCKLERVKILQGTGSIRLNGLYVCMYVYI